jgi:hypothetical protein
MKKMMVLALLAISIVGFAQKRETKGEKGREEMEKMTPEQRTLLTVKHLDLELDLNENQEKEIKTFLTSQESKRAEKMAPFKKKKEAKEKLSADERFALKNEMLNEQIAIKEKMKSVLTPEQFLKWEALKDKRKEQQFKRKSMQK